MMHADGFNPTKEIFFSVENCEVTWLSTFIKVLYSIRKSVSLGTHAQRGSYAGGKTHA